MATAKKFSRKREAILTCLHGTTCHPTAEWVYQQLKPDFPDLSLGTVYRNLSLFRAEGQAISVGTFAGLEHFGSFGAAHNVIGQGCDLRGVLGHGAYRFERLKNCHCYHPSVIFIRICYINIKSLSIIYFYIAFLFFVLYNYYIL